MYQIWRKNAAEDVASTMSFEKKNIKWFWLEDQAITDKAWSPM